MTGLVTAVVVGLTGVAVAELTLVEEVVIVLLLMLDDEEGRPPVA